MCVIPKPTLNTGMALSASINSHVYIAEACVFIILTSGHLTNIIYIYRYTIFLTPNKSKVVFVVTVVCSSSSSDSIDHNEDSDITSLLTLWNVCRKNFAVLIVHLIGQGNDRLMTPIVCFCVSSMYVQGLIMLEGKTSSQLVSLPPPRLTHSASFASWYGVLSSDGSQPIAVGHSIL